MKKSNTRTVKYRRKLEGKTNYKKRLQHLMSKKPRLVVRKSLKNMTAQLVAYEPTGDKVIASAHTKELEKMDWKANRGNIASAYLVGLLLAQKAKGKVKEVIVDLGMQISLKQSRLYATIKGAKDGGLNVLCDESMFPSDERVSGKHIADYAATLQKDNKEQYEKQFAAYLKAKVDPTKFPEYVSQLKSKLGAQ